MLKPLCGLEPQLYENLASFSEQEYPDYEIVLCLHDERDPAYAVAEALRAAFPSVAIRIALGENAAMANPKIANLAKPAAEPSGDLVVISDSDMHVGRDYLRAIASSFSGDRTGAATCLYSAMPNASFASALGAMHVEDEFAPSVLVALVMGKLRFCMGATMAVRRSVIYAIGGLEALGPHLADDHVLGELVAKAGYDVELSRYVPRTTVPETSLRELWSHELRWARTNFSLAPAGYVFSAVMYAFPIALLYEAIVRNVAGALLLTAIAALRLALHYAARRGFGSGAPDRPWLFPIRDAFSLMVWAASLAGRRVRWRGGTYTTKPES